VAAQAASDWPQLQYDAQRSGHNPGAFASAPTFSLLWLRNLNVPMAGRIQPVIASGYLIVGDLNGKVTALNPTNGNVTWTRQLGGAILYTAAIDQGRVFVGAHDGYLYALNLADGTVLWQARVPRGIGGAPLVWDGKVYVGGKNGYFYAFAAAGGGLLWQFDTAATNPASVRAPILSSAAVHGGKRRVFFAAENLKAYALNADTGALVWAFQMYGESAYDSWPVLWQSGDVVMFRTKSVYSFHASLGLDDAELFCPGQSGTGCGSCAGVDAEAAGYNSPVTTVTAGAPAQWNEQHGASNSIDAVFQNYPQRLTFYALDVDTGQHELGRPAPVLWTGGGGRVGIMPVVNQASNAIYTVWRSRYARRDGTTWCRKFVDLGRLGFDQTYPTMNFLPCAGGNNCPSYDFRLIGDESTVLSLGGNWLVLSNWDYVGALNVANGSTRPISGSGYQGDSGDSAAPASIANNVVYYIRKPVGQANESQPVTYVVAYRGQ
jgi:hypothetical protein